MTKLALLLAYGKFVSAREYAEIARALSLEEKIELSIRIIEEALRVAHTHSRRGDVRVSVAYSGGKASTVMLALVLHVVQPDEVHVYYNDTGLEFPENRQYVVKIVKEHFRVKNFYIVQSRVKPFWIWKNFGFPPPSRFNHWEPICCKLLKKIPAAIIVRRLGIDVEFVGLQYSESKARLAVLDRVGAICEVRSIGGVPLGKTVFRCAPVAFWRDVDLWKFLEREKIPTNPVYDRYGIDRQGCIFCTNTLYWERRIKHICNVLGRPGLYEYFLSLYRKWGVQKRRNISIVEVLERLGILKSSNSNCSNSAGSRKRQIEQLLPLLDQLYVVKQM